MNEDYAPRICIPLAGGTGIERPPEKPELVHMYDRAATVFIDFRRTRPVVIGENQPIDIALGEMRASGVCLLLVTDEAGAVSGLLTADECYGEAPVRLAQSSRIGHDRINAGMVMKPLADIRVLEWSHMKDARVGHIVATLNQLETGHLLVVERGRIRGVFAAYRIAKQLGHAVSEDPLPAHSLAEIVHTLG